MKITLVCLQYHLAQVVFSMGYGSIWTTGQYACGSKWNIESLAKHPATNYTAFGCNNMSNFLDYQILAHRFVLNLKK